MMRLQAPRHGRELGLLLVLGLLHGLLYWALVPPWQHYDEPTHFEYAQLLALRGYIVGRDDYDPMLRGAIADSMYAFRFDPPGVRRNFAGPHPPDIGITAKDHPKPYYLLAGLPVRLLAPYSVETQLYAARLFALVCYLLVIACAYRLACVLAPTRPVVRLGLPLLVALSPTFTDIMTAVNNDALANLTAAAFFLGCALLLRDGPRPTGLLLAVFGLLAALMVKRSTISLLPIVPLVVYWTLRRRPLRWWTYAASLGTAGLVVALLVFDIGVQPTVQAADAPADQSEVPAASVAVLQFRPWVDRVAQRLLRVHPNDMLQRALHNEQLQPQRLQTALRILFLSSTSRLGWSHVQLPQAWSIALASGLVVVVGGLLLNLLRPQAPLVPTWRTRVDWLAFWGLAGALAIVLAYLLLPNYTPNPYFPTGRYLFVMLLPMLLLLLRGVEGCLPPRWHDRGVLALVATFAALDLTAWGWTLIQFYYV